MKNKEQKSTEVLPTVERDSSLPTIAFNGYSFHCKVFGEEHKESVLVLHGGPGGDIQYLLPLKELADRFRVIFFDQRGTGFSPRVEPSGLTLEQYLQDVDAFISFYGKEGPVSIIGHSWGGYLALQYAAHHPQKIHRLVLAEPFIPDLPTRFWLGLHNVWNGIIPKMIRAKIRSLKVHATDPHAQKDYFFGELLRMANPGYQCPGRNTSIPMGRSGYYAFRKLTSSKKGAKRLKDIRFPAERMRLLVSDCNTLLGRKYQEKVLKKIRQPEMIEVSGAGHYLFQDNPTASLRLIREFLKA